MGIDGRRHPKGNSWSKKKSSGRGSGRPPSPGQANYMLAMEAGLVALLLLGLRILGELVRIRRIQPRGRYRGTR
jgi:hypothetical protein